MAAHLAQRHELTVWNRTASRATEFTATHRSKEAATPLEAARGAEVVITCLPNSTEVEEVLEGPAGIMAGLGAGALLLDCTSGEPRVSVRIAARLHGQGVAFADAPVSGGTNGAEAGTLTVMVGADEPTFLRAVPILSAFARRVEPCRAGRHRPRHEGD